MSESSSPGAAESSRAERQAMRNRWIIIVAAWAMVCASCEPSAKERVAARQKRWNEATGKAERDIPTPAPGELSEACPEQTSLNESCTMTAVSRLALRRKLQDKRQDLVGELREECQKIALGADWSQDKLRFLAELCRQTKLGLENPKPEALIDSELRRVFYELELLSGTIHQRFSDSMRK